MGSRALAVEGLNIVFLYCLLKRYQCLFSASQPFSESVLCCENLVVSRNYISGFSPDLLLQIGTPRPVSSSFDASSSSLGDACLCVPRRLLAGQRVFQAHRLHLFQRLHQAGWPHARVSSLYIAATALLALALLLGGWPWVVSLAALELLIGLWLDQRVAVPFAVASRA
jgi:hypothetical protein